MPQALLSKVANAPIVELALYKNYIIIIIITIIILLLIIIKLR